MPIQYLCPTHEFNCESQQTVSVRKPDKILGGILQIINIPCKSRLLLTYKFWYHWNFRFIICINMSIQSAICQDITYKDHNMYTNVQMLYKISKHDILQNIYKQANIWYTIKKHNIVGSPYVYLHYTCIIYIIIRFMKNNYVCLIGWKCVHFSCNISANYK